MTIDITPSSARIKFFLFAVAFWIFSVCTDFTPGYSKEVVVKSEVVQLYSGASGGKHSRLEFIVVYQDPNGYRFDRKVSAAFYSQAEVGQVYDIKAPLNSIYDEYRQGKNLIWDFGTSLLYFFTYVIAFILSVIVVLPTKAIDWIIED